MNRVQFIKEFNDFFCLFYGNTSMLCIFFLSFLFFSMKKENPPAPSCRRVSDVCWNIWGPEGICVQIKSRWWSWNLKCSEKTAWKTYGSKMIQFSQGITTNPKIYNYSCHPWYYFILVHYFWMIPYNQSDALNKPCLMTYKQRHFNPQ